MARKTAQEIVDGFDAAGVVETRAWLVSATVQELVDFCHKAGGHTKFCTMIELARAELALKTAEASERVHWTVTPNFWLTLIACLAAAGALWFGWRADVRDSRRDHTDVSSGHPAAPALSALSNSPPKLPP